MRFLVQVTQASETEGWTITVCREQYVVGSQRPMGRSDTNAWHIPFPIPSAADAQAAGPRIAELVANPKELSALQARILSRPVGGDDAVVFGQYLFTTLLGRDIWANIVSLAGEEPIELALEFPDQGREVSRLPWEMMYGPRGFLAQSRAPQVSISRVVPGTQQTVAALSVPLKVLVVVGTDLSQKTIHAGAEYMNLLRRLELIGEEIYFDSRVLVHCDTIRLQDEIKLFHPSVIHFISHGVEENGTGYLCLFVDKEDREEKKSAQVLVDAMTWTVGSKAVLPPIVVLNACCTAGSQTTYTPQSIPLAAQLVSSGIPIVVGMAGQVADRACRLFTQRFYEALLRQESITVATAEGRRAALIHGGVDPTKTVDWAFPTIFMGENVTPTLKFDKTGADWLDKTRLIISKYVVPRKPNVFCDRHDALLTYRDMVDRTAAKAPRVLAAEANPQLPPPDPVPPDYAPRYGMTYLLEHLAVRAVRDGHIPCLLLGARDREHSNAYEPPSSLHTLVVAICLAMLDTRERFGLGPPGTWNTVDKVQFDLKKVHHGWSPIPPELGYRTRLNDMYNILREVPVHAPFVIDTKTFSRALHDDLLTLRDEVSTKYPDPFFNELKAKPKVLLFLDEVHRWASGADALVAMLGPDGLCCPAEADDPIRVIFTCTRSGLGAGLQSMLETSKPDYIRRISLSPFPKMAADPLPYRQFLLYHEPPLVIRPGTKDDAKGQALLDSLDELVAGIPSRFGGGPENSDIAVTLLIGAKQCFLELADDNRVLEQYRTT